MPVAAALKIIPKFGNELRIGAADYATGKNIINARALLNIDTVYSSGICATHRGIPNPLEFK